MGTPSTCEHMEAVAPPAASAMPCAMKVERLADAARARLDHLEGGEVDHAGGERADDAGAEPIQAEDAARLEDIADDGTPLSDFPLPSTIWRVLITVRGYSAHVTPLNSAAPPTEQLRLSNFSQFTSPGGPGREGPPLSAAMAHAGTEISRRGDTPDASGDSRSTLSTSASVPECPSRAEQ